MKSISISDLKATLSEQVRVVRQGEEILVTDRGIPVAKLVPIEARETEAEDRLLALGRSGVLRRATAPLSAAFFEKPRPQDQSASLRGALGEEREGGW